MRGFFITGTDTGVGKTEVAAYLAKRFSKKGFRVGVMKPVATAVRKVSRDAKILKKSSGSKDPIDYINPISFRLPLAPLVASRLERRKLNKETIWDRFKELKSNKDVVIMEGIGGLMVPIYEERKKPFYILDFILKTRLPVIIVARPNLGTINHTLMTVKMLRSRKIEISGIIFNHTSRMKRDVSIKTNPGIIEELSGVRVLGIMYYSKDRNRRRMQWLRKLEF